MSTKSTPAARRPPASPAPRAPRRTGPVTRAEYDAQRSAATRTRILDAALEALLDVGYARTTTVEIGRRAKVARGTLLHHFPDRQSLMVASLRYVFERRFTDFEREAEALTRTHGSPKQLGSDALIDLLWRAIDAGTTAAWVELVVATRHDPPLRAELFRLMEEFDERVAQSFLRWVPAAQGAEPPRKLVFAVMNGLVLDRMMGRDEHVPAVLALLKAAAQLAGLGR